MNDENTPTPRVHKPVVTRNGKNRVVWKSIFEFMQTENLSDQLAGLFDQNSGQFYG
jgi:hypothetical protein